METGTSKMMQGIIREIDVGEVMATIRIQFGEDIIESVIRKDAIDDTGIKVGDRVTAMMESTRVTITR